METEHAVGSLSILMASLETPDQKRVKQRSIRQKKRPKLFMGNTGKVGEASSTAVSASGLTDTPERPAPVMTASGKKLAFSFSPQVDVSLPTGDDSDRDLKGTRLLDCQWILDAIGGLKCPEKRCERLVTVCEDFASWKGQVTTMKIV